MFGAWTEKAIRKYMARILPADVTLSGYSGKWEVRDEYRPGMVWRGKTPAQTLRKAGFWVPRNCCGYH
jgi:hypothetical protein